MSGYACPCMCYAALQQQANHSEQQQKWAVLRGEVAGRGMHAATLAATAAHSAHPPRCCERRPCHLLACPPLADRGLSFHVLSSPPHSKCELQSACRQRCGRRRPVHQGIPFKMLMAIATEDTIRPVAHVQEIVLIPSVLERARSRRPSSEPSQTSPRAPRQEPHVRFTEAQLQLAAQPRSRLARWEPPPPPPRPCCCLARRRRPCAAAPDLALSPSPTRCLPQPSMDKQLRESLQRRAAGDVAAAVTLLSKLADANGAQAQAVRRQVAALRRSCRGAVCRLPIRAAGSSLASPGPQLTNTCCPPPQRAAHRRRHRVCVAEQDWAGRDAGGRARLCDPPPAGEAAAHPCTWACGVARARHRRHSPPPTAMCLVRTRVACAGGRGGGGQGEGLGGAAQHLERPPLHLPVCQ